MAVLRYVKESPRTLYGVIRYVSDEKTTIPELIFGIGVNPELAYEEMMLVKRLYAKERQRQYKQMVLSFKSALSHHCGTTGTASGGKVDL